MPAILVQNDITESVLGLSSVRLTMDFGNITEILAGDLIQSATMVATANPSGPASVSISNITVTSGYLVTGTFTGGAAGKYDVRVTPTLVSGQVLPSRTGVLILQ